MPEGGAIESEKSASTKPRRLTDTPASVAQYQSSSVSSGCVTQRQAGIRSSQAPVLKSLFPHLTKGHPGSSDPVRLQRQKEKVQVASPFSIPNKVSRSPTSPLHPMDHFGGDRESPLKGIWAAAAARRVEQTTQTPTLLKTGKERRHTLPFTPPADNSGASLATVSAPEQSNILFPVPDCGSGALSQADNANPGAPQNSTGETPYVTFHSPKR